MTEVPEERQVGFITAVNYVGEQILKIHAHAKKNQASAKDDQERNIHEGVMIACELISKVIVNAASEVSPEFADLDTTPPETNTPDNKV